MEVTQAGVSPEKKRTRIEIVIEEGNISGAFNVYLAADGEKALAKQGKGLDCVEEWGMFLWEIVERVLRQKGVIQSSTDLSGNVYPEAATASNEVGH